MSEALRDQNRVPTMLGVDDVTGETRPVATDSDGNVIVVLSSASSFTLSALRFQETGGGTNTITLQAPATVLTSFTLTLPGDDGTSGQFLQTNGSGILSWQTVAGGGDMLIATYDPAGVSEQLLGLTAAQVTTNKTLVTPTIASFVNATHSHLNAAGGGTITAAAVSDFDTQVRTSRLDQMAAPGADVSMNSHKLTNLTNPTNAQDAVTKTYADGIASGLSIKASCALATIANVPGTYVGSPTFTLTEVGFGALVIDGVTPTVGDRVLLKIRPRQRKTVFTP